MGLEGEIHTLSTPMGQATSTTSGLQQEERQQQTSERNGTYSKIPSQSLAPSATTLSNSAFNASASGVPPPTSTPASFGIQGRVNGGGNIDSGGTRPPALNYIHVEPQYQHSGEPRYIHREINYINLNPPRPPQPPQPQPNITPSNPTAGNVDIPSTTAAPTTSQPIDPTVNGSGNFTVIPSSAASTTTQPIPPTVNGSTAIPPSTAPTTTQSITPTMNGSTVIPQSAAPTTAQPIRPAVNGSGNQDGMGSRPKAATAVPNAAKKPNAPLASTAAAPAAAPLVTNVPNVPSAPIRKATATAVPKLKRKTLSTPRGSGTGAKRSRKRKSGKFDDDDDVIRAGDSSTDESDEPALITTMTKSGRQVNRPTAFVPPPPQEAPESPTTTNQETQEPQRKKRRMYRKGRENNVTCTHCWRAHSPASNTIVFCDECNGAWHQFCHDPPIGNEVIIVKEAQWFCRECRPVEGEPTAQSFLDKPVPNEVFPVASQVLVGGSQFTPDQRQGYLAGLSHAALVKILLNVSNAQPDLAIFPENVPELLSSAVLPQAPKASKATLDLSTTAATTISTATTSSTYPSNQTIAVQTFSASAPISSAAASPRPPPPAASMPPAPPTTILITNDDDEDVLLAEYRLYPRAGHGFRLPPDSTDLDMLLEDPSCNTFSHALHGPAKARAEANGVQWAVGGVA